MSASEGRRRRRRRDTTPDEIGFAMKRRLLERVVEADPAADGFEAFLVAWDAGEPAPGPARAIAREGFGEWRLARSSPAFRAWLLAGAPSDDALGG
jgi:hypothetical protein